MASSGAYLFNPSLAELFIDAFSRLQLRGPAITQEFMAEARRSANLLLVSDWATSGINLWAITPDGAPDIQIPLLSGVYSYQIPPNTVSLLDCYLRTFTPGTATVDLGNALTAVVTMAGVPVVSSPYGDVAVQQPPSGVFSCTAGSQTASMSWASHGLATGAPLFWGCPISLGGLSLSGFSIVSGVVDSNTLQFELPVPAFETQTNLGGTPLFYTQSGSGTVTCLLPGHGLKAGSTFTVPISTTVGGLTLSGSYTVVAVQNLYQFTFTPGGTASSTATGFENGGKINVVSQASGTDMTDVYLSPLSRNEYAMLPDKFSSGRPTQFWFNRAINPTVMMWPVPPAAPPYYGFVAYRMRELQDANPIMGQTLDAPRRFLEAFVSGLTAKLAEKFKPAVHKEKLALAQLAWDAASTDDRERVSTVHSIAGVY